MSFTPTVAYPSRGNSAAASRIIPTAALLRSTNSSSKRPANSPTHGPVPSSAATAVGSGVPMSTTGSLVPALALQLSSSTSPSSSVPASPNHKKLVGATSALIPQDLLAKQLLLQQQQQQQQQRRPSLLAASEVLRAAEEGVVEDQDGSGSTPTDGNHSSVDSVLNPLIMDATFDQEFQSFHTTSHDHQLHRRGRRRGGGAGTGGGSTRPGSFHSSPSETPPHSFTPVDRMSPVTISSSSAALMGTSVPTSVGSSQTNSNMSSTASSSPSSPQSTSKHPHVYSSSNNNNNSSSSTSSSSNTRGTSNKPSNRVRGTKAPPAAAYANRPSASDNTSGSGIATTTSASTTTTTPGSHQRSLTDGQGLLLSSASAASLLHHSRPHLQQLLVHSPTGAAVAISPSSSFTQPPLHHGSTGTNHNAGGARSGLHSPISPQSPAGSSPALRRAHSHTSSTLMFPHIGTLNSPVRTPTRTPSPAITSMGGIANGGKLIVPQTISVPSGFSVVAKEMDHPAPIATNSSSMVGSPSYSFTSGKKKASAFVFPSSASFNALSSPTHSASTSNLASPASTPAKSSVEASLKRRMSLNAPLPLQLSHSASAHHLHPHAHHLHVGQHHLPIPAIAASSQQQPQQQSQLQQHVHVHRSSEEQESASQAPHLEPIASQMHASSSENHPQQQQHYANHRSSLVTREREDLLSQSHLPLNHSHSHGSHHTAQHTPLLSPLERRPSLAHTSVTASPASASPANGNSPRVSRIREDALSVANAASSLFLLGPLSLHSASQSAANSPSVAPSGTYYSESGASSILSSKIGSMVSPALSFVDQAPVTSQLQSPTARYDALLPSAAVVPASAAHCMVSSFPLYVSAKKKRSYTSHITYCEAGGLMKDNTVGAPTAASALRSPTAAAASASDPTNPSAQNFDASQLRADALASSLIDTSSNYTFSPQRYTQLFKSHFQKKSHQAVFGLFSGFNSAAQSEPLSIDPGVFFAQYFQQHFLTYLDMYFPDVTALTAGSNSNAATATNGAEAIVDLRPYLKHSTELCIDAMQAELASKLSGLQAPSAGEPAPEVQETSPSVAVSEGSGCAFVIALISGGVLYTYNSSFTVGSRGEASPSFQALVSRGASNHFDLNVDDEKGALSFRSLEKEDRFMVLSSVPLLSNPAVSHSVDPAVSSSVTLIDTAPSAQEAVNRIVEHRRSKATAAKSTTDEKLLLSIIYF